MKTPLSLLLAALTVLIAAPADVAISSFSPIANRAPDWLEQWLDQDVVYTISKEERAAFLKLENDKDRKDFIEQFWWRRNPDPESIENTFELEHYRRIGYANSHFGRKATPGWQTDRGHVYIVFGAPDRIDPHPKGPPGNLPDMRSGERYPYEVWSYKYLDGFGTDWELQFVDEAGAGDYKSAMGDSFWRTTDSVATASGPCVDCRTGILRSPVPNYRDLMELLTARIVRNQISFEHTTTVQAVTDCTSLASIGVSVPVVNGGDAEKAEPFRTDKSGFEILIRVQDMSGRIVQVSEGTLPASYAPREIGSTDPPETLTKAFPLFVGLYRVQIAIKNVQTDQIGIQSLRLEVPSNPVHPH